VNSHTKLKPQPAYREHRERNRDNPYRDPRTAQPELTLAEKEKLMAVNEEIVSQTSTRSKRSDLSTIDQEQRI
jgi:hypothetical protein